jgi:heterodisulfide reductase subunit A
MDAHLRAVVIGGGVAGMRAALDLSSRGIEVVLIEKTPFLGGRTANLSKLFPTGEKAEELIRQFATDMLNDPNITVFTCAEIIHSEGYVGNFKITVKQHSPEPGKYPEATPRHVEGENTAGFFLPFAGYYPENIPAEPQELDIETGAIVLATGFQTYTPYEGEYGYGQYPEVITLPQLIQFMAEVPSEERILKINGRYIRRAALIHCVGSRKIPGMHEPDENGNLNEYCSRTCCTATLQAANEIREHYPDTRVFEYYRDIRTYGRGHEDYYESASRNQVLFFRYEPDTLPVVEPAKGVEYPLTVSVKDTLTFGEKISAEVDLVVLAVGMEPSPINDLVKMMKLPVGADRFLKEVHPKLRPVELANTGVLLAGTCQAPMDIGEACTAAQAASAKAAALLSKGYVELDPFVAEVNMDRCSGTGACVDACPIEGAIQLAEMEIEGQPVRRGQVNPALCNGCGICVAVCPDNAVDVKGWTLQQYEDMVDAIVAI